MAVTTIPTAGIADDAVGNTKLDLTANYAFTGTVTGVPSGLNKITVTYTIPSSTSEFNLNGIFTTTYDQLHDFSIGLGVTSSGGLIGNKIGQASDNSHITTNYTSLAYRWWNNRLSKLEVHGDYLMLLLITQ